VSLAQASEKYFANLEARELDAKSIRAYRTGIDPFVRTCERAHVEDVTRQDLIDFMGWLHKQPLLIRRNSNPERTYNNKVGYVAILLKEFGGVLKKKDTSATTSKR
jgi:site-specific recombinase XerD